MYLNQLKINGFRCYDNIEIEFNQRINVFHGDNGAGKTSILEAIYYLSTGKSFRSKRAKNLINQVNHELTLFSAFTSDEGIKGQVGVSLDKGLKKKIKLNQRNVSNQSEIAHLIPVVSIDPDSYLFLDKPPQFRRSFLD
ncbi:MAG: AAA family ATPase, partial [Marinicella sp.]